MRQTAQRANRRVQGEAQRAVGEHLGGATLERKVVAGGPSGLLELFPSRQGGEGELVVVVVEVGKGAVGARRTRRSDWSQLGKDPSSGPGGGWCLSFLHLRCLCLSLFLSLGVGKREWLAGRTWMAAWEP